MDDDGLTAVLRENIIALVEIVADTSMLDLVYKLLSANIV